MGFLQIGHRRAGVAIRRLSRRPLRNDAAADVAVLAISLACAATMIFIVPRREVVVSEELIEQAEEEESGMM